MRTLVTVEDLEMLKGIVAVEDRSKPYTITVTFGWWMLFAPRLRKRVALYIDRHKVCWIAVRYRLLGLEVRP